MSEIQKNTNTNTKNGNHSININITGSNNTIHITQRDSSHDILSNDNTIVMVGNGKSQISKKEEYLIMLIRKYGGKIFLNKFIKEMEKHKSALTMITL